MARAAELLIDGVLPIKAIAFNCGYTRITNFYRDFKSVYGTSPRQMRLMQMNAQLHDGKSLLARSAALWPIGSAGR